MTNLEILKTEVKNGIKRLEETKQKNLDEAKKAKLTVFKDAYNALANDMQRGIDWSERRLSELSNADAIIKIN